MRRPGFTLIELLVIIGIIAAMVTVSVVNVRAGQGAARVRGAARDIFAAIRHARSTALVTLQPAVVTYSTAEEDGEVVAKVEVYKAELFNTASDTADVQTLSGEPLKDKGRELVHIEEEGGDALAEAGATRLGRKEGEKDGPEEKSGETVEEILFKPMDTETVKGMRLKVVKGDEAIAEAGTGRKTKISVFSNVDYLIGRFESAKAKAKEEAKKEGAAGDARGDDGEKSSKLTDEEQEPVSVVWETNGRVDPHQVWVYADGQKPEDGLLIKIDRFGAAKVISGDGKEDD